MSDERWFTAKELAGLPGLPSTDRRVNAKAKREAWSARKREGSKAWEYPLSALPEETRAHLAAQVVAETAQQESPYFEAGAELGRQVQQQEKADQRQRQTEKERALREWNELPEGPKKSRAKARLWVLERLWQYRREHGGGKQETRAAFCDLLNEGSIPAPDWIWEWMPQYQGRKAVTPATLQRWERGYEQRGRMGLTDGYGNRAGDNKIERNPELKEVVLGTLLQAPHIGSKKIKEYVAAAYPHLDVASEGSIRRYINRWIKENHQLWTYLTNPDRWKNIYMVAYGSHHENVVSLNQVWEMDSTPGDWMLTDGRHEIIAAIDLYSRWAHLRVAPTSDTRGVCQVWRQAALDLGVPEVTRTDNGQEYISDQFDAVLADLEVDHQVCLPFASEQKGTVERFLQTMAYGILDQLPGFIGHNVADRQLIEARKSFAKRVMSDETVEVQLSSDELQQILDDWLNHYYVHEPHEGHGGKTPFQVRTEYDGPVRRISDERALDALLADVAGYRTVSKQGIKFDNRYYFDPVLPQYHGERVQLKYDDADLGRLYVYHPIEGFLCVATNPDLAGVSRQEATAVSAKVQKDWLSQKAAEYREFKKGIHQNLSQVVLRERAERNGQLTPFRGPGEEHTTAGLQAAGEAARADDAPQQDEELVEQAKAAGDVVELDARPTDPDPATLSDLDRYRLWWDLERRQRAGETLRPDLQQFHASFPQSRTFRDLRELDEDFGGAAEGGQ